MRGKGKNNLARKMLTVPMIDRLVSDPGEKELRLLSDCVEAFGVRGRTNGDLIRTMYAYVAEEFRCEYYFKNELAKWILTGGCPELGRTVSAEQSVGKSRVDMVSVEPEYMVAYEIKTSLDTFARLQGQLADYYRVFPYAYVVVEESMVQVALNEIGSSSAGAIGVSPDGKIYIAKEAVLNVAELNHAAIFERIRKPEYLEIIARRFGSIPNVNDFDLYGACLGLFSQNPAMEAHGKLVKCYLRRAEKQRKGWGGGAPEELTLYSCLTKNTRSEELMQFWKVEIGGWIEKYKRKRNILHGKWKIFS